MRDFMDTLRAGGITAGGPPALNKRDRQSFANHLDKVLTRFAKGRVFPSLEPRQKSAGPDSGQSERPQLRSGATCELRRARPRERDAGVGVARWGAQVDAVGNAAWRANPHISGPTGS